MDYERESDGETGQQPDASGTPMTDGQSPPAEAEATATATDDAANAEATDTQGATEPPQSGSDAMPDLGTDADVMNDSFESREPAPPEWPAADLVGATDASTTEATDDSTASTEIAATYAAATDEPSDVGDDSDAPILEDATAASASAAAESPQSFIQADNVTLRQAGAQTIQASTVSVTQGGAGQVHADTVTVEQGGLGLARTKTLTLGSGASAFAVVADEATVEEGSNAFLVVSRSFNGDVQPTIDWRVAAAFGAGLGLVLSIFRRRR